jgi:UDP-glucose:(heptosyl)LPS alpha-1,3-glucosyltransferase
MSLEIIQVVQEFSTEGGVETVAFELARAFSRLGIKNTVLASAVGGQIAQDTQVLRVAPWLARIPTRGIFRHLGRMIVVPIFTVAATLALRRFQHAVVISHGDTLSGDLLVVHAVNAESLAEKRQSGHWKWRFNPMHYWVALRDRWMIGGLRFRLFAAVSERVSHELQHHFGVPASRIRVLNNGIDLSRFRQSDSARHRIRTEFAIPDDSRLLLFVGHEFDRKGLAFVIDALHLLDASYRLLVVGSDNPAPYRKLASTAQARVIFAGARRDVADFYAACDAFVFPSAYETFSLVCMEALAAGKPIFATRVGGIEDYLQEGVNGFPITRNGSDIAAKLQQAYASPEDFARLSQGARATAERFGWDSVAAQYLEVLEELDRDKQALRIAAPVPAG